MCCPCQGEGVAGSWGWYEEDRLIRVEVRGQSGHHLADWLAVRVEMEGSPQPLTGRCMRRKGRLTS